ncbi:MAG: hypothetical protein V1664_01240 [Candidatus Uhrbacteria bacterium]
MLDDVEAARLAGKSLQIEADPPANATVTSPPITVPALAAGAVAAAIDFDITVTPSVAGTVMVKVVDRVGPPVNTLVVETDFQVAAAAPPPPAPPQTIIHVTIGAGGSMYGPAVAAAPALAAPQAPAPSPVAPPPPSIIINLPPQPAPPAAPAPQPPPAKGLHPAVWAAIIGALLFFLIWWNDRYDPHAGAPPAGIAAPTAIAPPAPAISLNGPITVNFADSAPTTPP